MPLLAVPANAAIIAASMAGASFHGISTAQVALGIATGLATYAPGIVIATVDTGTLGVGKGTGIGLIMPPPVGQMVAAFASSVLVGIFSAPAATAVALGLTQIFATAIINTVDPLVGVGAGVVTAIPNPGISVPAFIAGFKAAGLLGIASVTMATAVAIGLDTALPTAKGVTVIAGAPSPFPGAGAGVGVMS